jgi:hypothetical protein
MYIESKVSKLNTNDNSAIKPTFFFVLLGAYYLSKRQDANDSPPSDHAKCESIHNSKEMAVNSKKVDLISIHRNISKYANSLPFFVNKRFDVRERGRASVWLVNKVYARDHFCSEGETKQGLDPRTSKFVQIHCW